MFLAEAQEIKKRKKPIAAVTVTKEALWEQQVLASRRQCSCIKAGAMTSSSRTNVKIKFPSPAGMIDDGKGKHRFQGKARKQPGNAWKWEMLTVQSSTGSDPAPYGVTPAASLCCSSPLSILAFVLPREGCPSPWPLGMSSLPLFLSPRCTLWDCEVFRSFPQ